MSRSNLPAPPSTAEIRAYLDDIMALFLARRDQVLIALNAMHAAHPRIDSDEVQAAAADNIRLAKAWARLADEHHKTHKRPFLDGGRTVDTWFREASAPLAGVVLEIERAMTDYAQRLEARQRRIAEHEAARCREEAQRAATEAARAMQSAAPEIAEAKLVTAAEIAQRAEAAETYATARAAEHSRTVGDYGAVASLRTKPDFDVVNFAEVPDQYKVLNEVAIRSALRTGVRAIPGLRIFEQKKIGVR